MSKLPCAANKVLAIALIAVLDGTSVDSIDSVCEFGCRLDGLEDFSSSVQSPFVDFGPSLFFSSRIFSVEKSQCGHFVDSEDLSKSFEFF
jgi:hypothetical protein